LPPDALELALPNVSADVVSASAAMAKKSLSLCGFAPMRKLMLSAGPLFTPRFSWSASLVKPGFFAFVKFRHLPLQ
jgi:hypothetical protein